MKIFALPFLLMAAAIGGIIFLVIKGMKSINPSTNTQKTMPTGGAGQTTPVQQALNSQTNNPSHPVMQTQGSTGDWFTNSVLPNAPKIIQTIGDVLGLNSPSPTQGDTSGVVGSYDPASTYSTDPNYTWDSLNQSNSGTFESTGALDLNSLSNDFSSLGSLTVGP